MKKKNLAGGAARFCFHICTGTHTELFEIGQLAVFAGLMLRGASLWIQEGGKVAGNRYEGEVMLRIRAFFGGRWPPPIFV